MINYSTLENIKKIDYKALLLYYIKIINILLILKNYDNIDKYINKEIIQNLFKSLMKKFALVIFFIIKLIHVLMIILIY